MMEMTPVESAEPSECRVRCDVREDGALRAPSGAAGRSCGAGRGLFQVVQHWPVSLRRPTCGRGCQDLSPVHGQEGSRVWDHYADCVHDEEQDGDIVESASYPRLGSQLGDTPGNECQDSHEPHEGMASLGRMSDAHGCDGAGDKEQRHGGRARMVGPPDVAADPVGNDKQDTSGDGDHAKADSGEEPDAGRVQMLKLIHCPDAIAALHGRDLQRRLARGGTAGGLTGAPGRSRLQRKLVLVSLRSSVRDRPGQLKGLSAREPANGMAWLSFRWRGAGR